MKTFGKNRIIFQLVIVIIIQLILTSFAHAILPNIAKRNSFVSLSVGKAFFLNDPVCEYLPPPIEGASEVYKEFRLRMSFKMSIGCRLNDFFDLYGNMNITLGEKEFHYIEIKDTQTVADYWGIDNYGTVSVSFGFRYRLWNTKKLKSFFSFGLWIPMDKKPYLDSEFGAESGFSIEWVCARNLSLGAEIDIFDPGGDPWIGVGFKPVLWVDI